MYIYMCESKLAAVFSMWVWAMVAGSIKPQLICLVVVHYFLLVVRYCWSPFNTLFPPVPPCTLTLIQISLSTYVNTIASSYLGMPKGQDTESLFQTNSKQNEFIRCLIDLVLDAAIKNKNLITLNSDINLSYT